MNYFLYILLFFSLTNLAQQTGQYSQFTFNKYGYNPAAAGSNINAKLEAIVGARKQWVGFADGPISNFFSANYTFKPERSYKRWHNAGIYASQEKAGIFQNFSLYGSYTLHLPLTNKLKMSFGIFAGIKRFYVNTNSISPSDPVYAVSYQSYFYAYPDFIPGFRLYSKKMFFDISVQQLYKNQQVQGDKQFGHKSFLTPQLYATYGKRIFFDNGFTVVPAVNIHSSFTHIPAIELNVMAYYLKRVGIGASIKNKNFISGILQIRFHKTLTAGFAYDYSINRLNSTAPNSIEIMLGITPLMNFLDPDKTNHNVSKCPNFDF
jgi:type IX secretion system PorP/SprF family membrane protein